MLAGAVETFGVSYRAAEDVRDLLRVLAALTGAPDPGRDAPLFDIVCDALERGPHGAPVPGEASCDFLHVKWFANGNAHIKVVDPELRRRMDEVLEGGAGSRSAEELLRPPVDQALAS